ncbi:DNA mismatch endonuclease Vsr [Mucilaginibacter sp. L196]|uniref:very short patch repair endonuclease n=1 Tax=Mucilaginibacter sp. L196 TaxID=1641870 RepID=UPI00131E1209|nr:DNA mismatch endonuclease Vsr [Mucilaginibacter sp. L196]
MADVHNKETRSFNMSRIRSKNTKPEMLVRKFLFSKGLRYRIHVSNLPGKPDLVLPKYRTVIFIHGCYWHGHENCRYFIIPKTNTEWWLNKITTNADNDRKANRCLTEMGWKIVTIWECELKKSTVNNTLKNLLANFKTE